MCDVKRASYNAYKVFIEVLEAEGVDCTNRRLILSKMEIGDDSSVYINSIGLLEFLNRDTDSLIKLDEVA